MIASISACLRGLDDAGLLDRAAGLASTFGAHLTALLVTPVPQIVVIADPTVEARHAAALRTQASDSGDLAEKALAQRLDTYGLRTDLRRIQFLETVSARAVTSAARYSDLVVLSTSPAGEDQLAERVVFASGRPCLVLPGTPAGEQRFGTIVVGWNDTPAAATAVASAMPFLLRADRVIVLALNSTDDARSGQRLVRHLARQGATAALEADIAPEPMGAALLEIASWRNADLLVAGAYGGNRFGDWLTGSVTRHLLQHATLPVLLSH